jgi:hypothetical protein
VWSTMFIAPAMQAGTHFVRDGAGASTGALPLGAEEQGCEMTAPGGEGPEGCPAGSQPSAGRVLLQCSGGQLPRGAAVQWWPAG